MFCREKNIGRMLGPLLTCLVFFIGGLSLCPAVMAEDRPLPVKEISVAVAQDYPPSYFCDKEGHAVGWMVDIWRMWSQKTAIKVKFVSVLWADALKLTREGKVDVLGGGFYTEERATHLDYVAPLGKGDGYFFFHKNIYGLETLKDLLAYRIGVIKGDFTVSYLREHLPGASLVVYNSNEEMFEALKSGALRVFVLEGAVARYFLKQWKLLSSFNYHPGKPVYSETYWAAVKKGDTLLPSIIKEGLALITPEEMADIEKRWMGASQTKTEGILTIACDRYYPPFTELTPAGRPAGIFIDLWRLWAQKTKRKIEFVFEDWEDTIRLVKEGKADIHSGLSFSKEREQQIGFSRQIYQTASRIYHRSGINIPANLGDLGEKVLGVQSGTWQEAQIRRMYPELRLRGFATNTELVDALVEGAVDAILQEDILMDAVLRNMGLQGDVVSRPERLLASTIHAGTARNRSKLLTQVNQGLSLLTDSELAEIETRWITDPEHRFYGHIMRDAEIGLTTEERVWLNAHPIIRVGADRAWPPYEYLDETGTYRGAGAVFLKRVGDMLGIRFQPPASLSWTETEAMARSRKLDLLPVLAPTPERRNFFSFTKPYLNWPNVIAIRADASGIRGIEDLKGRKVGVVDGYAIHQTLTREHPDLNLVPQSDVSSGLLALSTGQIDAFIGAPGAIEHFMGESGLDNIVLAAPTPYQLDMAFAVRKDWPELAAILDKTLGKIPPEERIRLLEEAGLSSEIVFAKQSSEEPGLLSTEMKIILGLACLTVVALLLFLIRLIRTQQRPFLHGLRGKSLVFMGVLFLLIGGGTLWALFFVGDRISNQLGQYIAERHVLWHKEKVLGSVQRELALANQMAESELLIRWAVNEDDPAIAAQAREELQRYHNNFRARTYFVGLAQSGHYFYSGDKVDTVSLKVMDTLSPEDKEDVWFFSTMSDPAPYNLNVDHNPQLGVTNLWVNFALRHDGETYGVVGTGIQLTDFIGAFITQKTKGVTAMMIDSNGAIQAHVDTSKIALNPAGQEGEESGGIWNLLKLDEDKEILRTHLDKLKKGESEAETFFLNLEGKRTLVAIAYLEPLKWYTVAIFEPGSLVGIQEMGAMALVLALSCLLTVVLFIVGQNALIIRPLDRLTQGARRLSSGDYDVRLPVEQRDEIGDLTETFNDMAGTIADYTRNLEILVQERTNELHTSEERSRLILASMSEGIFGLDPEGKAVFVNPAAAAMLGYTAEELVGQVMHAKVHHTYPNGAEFPRRECPMYQSIQDGSPHIIDTEVLWRKDGTAMQVEYSTTPIRKDDQTAGIVVSFRDITERKQAEDAIKDSEERMTQIIDFLPDPTWVIDMEGKVVAWNRALEEITSIKADEMLGKGNYEYAIPFYGERRPVLIDLVRAWDESYEKQYLSIKKIGEILVSESFHSHLGEGGIYLAATAHLIHDTSGEVVGAIESLRDITESKHSEKELRERMEELERFSLVTINREEKMIQLKDEINALLEQTGKEKKYKIVE